MKGLMRLSSALLNEQVEKVISFNGINVYKINQNRFKTNTINIFFHDSLTKENASLNALMPAVLRRGCERFPTLRDIALYLEELYGAVFDCGVAKKGERQIIQFYAEYISDKYTLEDEGLLDKVFSLLLEIITQPVLVNGVFKEDYVTSEKENLKRLIESRVNDKVQYAVERCFEEMCTEEPFGIYDYGSIEDIEKIDSKALYQHYTKALQTMPVDIYFTGDIDNSKIIELSEKLKNLERTNIKNVGIGEIDKDVKEVKIITEKMNVNQGKLTMGFRTYIAPGSKEYYSLMVYSTVLGGGMHSKLFQNVREKASLAYYAFSRLEKFKGLMVISSGIESENKDKAIDIINKQLEDIKKGKISDYEYDSTLKSIETGIKSLKDSQLQMVDFYMSQDLTGQGDNFDTLVEKVKKVTKEDIVKAAKNIKLDTIYFLTSA